MFLAIDVGNTHTGLGLFAGGRLVRTAKIRTVREATPDELGVLVEGVLAAEGGRAGLSGAALASVVPPVEPAWDRYLAGLAWHKVDHRSPLAFDLDVPRPETVGPDRLVDAEAGLALAGPPLILVDLGTALTVCAVAPGPERPRWIGGAIAPGIDTAAEGLYARAARLRSVPLELPPRAIGRTTEENLQSGLLFGFAGLIDGLVERFRGELAAPEATVLATGGGVGRIVPALRTSVRVEPYLTLEGLRRVAARVGIPGA